MRVRTISSHPQRTHVLVPGALQRRLDTETGLALIDGALGSDGSG